MTRPLGISIALNIAGLAVMTTLESWRPGFVSGAVNVGIVWLGAVGLIALGLIMTRKNQ